VKILIVAVPLDVVTRCPCRDPLAALAAQIDWVLSRHLRRYLAHAQGLHCVIPCAAAVAQVLTAARPVPEWFSKSTQ
jgi:hypothetical protein